MTTFASESVAASDATPTWPDLFERLSVLQRDPHWVNLVNPANLASAASTLALELKAAVDVGVDAALERLGVELVLVGLQLSCDSEDRVLRLLDEALARRETAADQGAAPAKR